MPNYDSVFFSPPAPVAYVILRNPDNNIEISNVPMLLDTGADGTLIPQIFAEKLGLDLSLTRWETEAFDGTKSESAVARLQMIFDGKSFRGDFLLIAQDYGIIGRNILNFLNIQFDGKNLRWDIM